MSRGKTGLLWEPASFSHGTFGYQLAFYQRYGFRVTSIDKDFFLKNYDEPIFENGIQLFDMLRLTVTYTGGGA